MNTPKSTSAFSPDSVRVEDIAALCKLVERCWKDDYNCPETDPRHLLWLRSKTKHDMDAIIARIVFGGTTNETGKAPAPEPIAIPQKRQPDDVPRAGRMSDEELLLNLVVSLLGDGVSKLTAIGNDAVSQYARRIKLARAAARLRALGATPKP